MKRSLVLCSMFLVACRIVPSEQDACEEAASAQCAKLDECRHEGVAESYGDLSTCVARRAESCVASLDSPDTGNSPLSIEDCAHATPAQSCQDYLQGIPVPACVTPAGARMQGDPCMFNSECDTAFCAHDPSADCGACAPMPSAGDECTDQACGYDLACTVNKLCAPWSAAGESCDADSPCGPDTWCVTAIGATTGTCTPSGATVGAACDRNKHTAPGCDFNLGLFCNTLTAQCAPIVYVGDGEPCGVINGDSNVCIGGASCRGTPALCVADAFDGDPCDTAVGPSCMSPARCVTDGISTSGTCQPPDPEVCTP